VVNKYDTSIVYPFGFTSVKHVVLQTENTAMAMAYIAFALNLMVIM